MQRLSRTRSAPALIKSRLRPFCSVPQCRSYSTRTISLHSFPSDKKLCNRWKTVLKIGKPISECMLVCSLHFLPENFVLGKVKRLKKGVIPSQKLPVTTSAKEKKKARKKIKTKDVISIDDKNEDVIYVKNIVNSLSTSSAKTEKNGVKPKTQHLFHEDKHTQTDFSHFIEIRYKCTQCTKSS